jgi:hypothetical protein
MTKNKTYYTIENHEGRWLHDSTWISELGFVMVKFYNEDKKVFMSVNMGTLEDALKTPYGR